MQIIEGDSRRRIRPLLERRDRRSHMTLAWEVLEGRRPGRVLADDAQNPRAALVCNDNGFYLAFGMADAEAFRAFLPVLESEYLTGEDTALLALSVSWEKALQECGRPTIRRIGFEYAPGTEATDAATPLPEGLTLERMALRRAEQIGGASRTSFGLDPWFLRIAGGPEAYLRDSFGWCVAAEEKVVSFCGVCALGGGEVELEVGTDPEFRGLGLATAACRAFLRECAERGLTPAYTCAADNAPSRAVARKLGFHESEEAFGISLRKPS